MLSNFDVMRGHLATAIPEGVAASHWLTTQEWFEAMLAETNGNYGLDFGPPYRFLGYEIAIGNPADGSQFEMVCVPQASV